MMGGFLAKALEAILRIGMAFFAYKKLGKQEAKIKQLEEENEDYENIIGFDDAYLADKLRERAKLKEDKDKRKR